MTPKEIFPKTVERKQPDQVCIEFVGGCGSASIVDQALYDYSALCKYLKLRAIFYPYRSISDFLSADGTMEPSAVELDLELSKPRNQDENDLSKEF